MAVRDLLTPFYIHNKTMALQPFLMIPTLISWLRKGFRSRHSHFVCSHHPPEIDMFKYRDKFAQRLALAGLKPHHRTAIAVSGGPDSIALCVLTGGWKSEKFDAANKGSKPVEGLLAIVVDHGLRTESAEEANLVRRRVLDMGIKCEVARCEWLDGRPKLGHLQEAARNKRYETLQRICVQQQISTLLIAHHADDQAGAYILHVVAQNDPLYPSAIQIFHSYLLKKPLSFQNFGNLKEPYISITVAVYLVSKSSLCKVLYEIFDHHFDDAKILSSNSSIVIAELFILRSSRNSGVLGLAGTAFTTEIFSELIDFSEEESKPHGILLVRPLLEFSKEDMYNICQGGNQQWVEDPTNRSPLYARNRIRMSLNDLSSSVFKAELQAVVAECRRTRLHVQKLCHLLLNQAVTITPHGYAVIDLVTLHAMEVKDIYLAKFAALVVQFISQRHRPVRGNGLKLLMNYLRTFPCKTCLTVAGCYLCPAPGSKGNKALVCCSVDLSVPPVIKLCRKYSYSEQEYTNELEQIVRNIEANLDKFMSDVSSVPFLEATSSESVLVEAKRIGILSDSSHKAIVSLQKQESEKFIKSKAETITDSASKDNITSSGSKSIRPGKAGHFMNRFLLDWKVCSQCNCICCVNVDEMEAEVRHMADADWIYIYDLSKKQLSGETMDYAILSAGRALASLKSIPIAARRSMPVLVNSKGVLLSIPSIGFSCCPYLSVSAVFHPRIPLGGGHSSFM